MALFGFRKFPTPVAKPMAPFFVATVITYYLVSKAQNAGVNCAFLVLPTISFASGSHGLNAAEEHRNSPKNPYAAQIAAQKAHH
ncbi:hypothetical protein FRC10_000711 [Ceratobasidium sp. 414]|nr:hypothetical protein FRC10_000711 [Ceratobasidium sp. 414]